MTNKAVNWAKNLHFDNVGLLSNVRKKYGLSFATLQTKHLKLTGKNILAVAKNFKVIIEYHSGSNFQCQKIDAARVVFQDIINFWTDNF